MKKLVVFSSQRYIIFICSRGTREGRKRPTPMRETGTPRKLRRQGKKEGFGKISKPTLTIERNAQTSNPWTS